jgi:hypothetical protein
MVLKLKFIGKTSKGASKYEIQPTVVTPATPAIPASGTGANKIEAVPAVPESNNLAEILGSLTDGLVVSKFLESEDGTLRTLTSRTHCYLTPKVGDIKELNIVTKDIDGVDNTYFVGNDREMQEAFNLKANINRELKPIKELTSALDLADISTSDYVTLSKALLEIAKLKAENKLLGKQLVAQ